jgi:hypothetical protein
MVITMMKKMLHSFLVGMLFFSFFGNFLLFAQEDTFSETPPPPLEETLPPSSADENNDIYIDINHP